MPEIKFTSNVKAVLSQVDQARDRALEIIGGTCENYAAEAAPFRTGRLSASYTHTKPSGGSVTVGSNVEYAIFQELGTRKMKARPHLRPAVEEHTNEYQFIAANEFGKIK